MYNYHKSFDINGVRFHYRFTTTVVTAIKIMFLLVLEELAYIDQSRRRVSYLMSLSMMTKKIQRTTPT